jgi:predicted PurR-regulated permease PerM
MSQHIEAPGPNEFRDPLVRQELRKAAIWIGLAILAVLVWLLTQPLLLIIGGVVFAAMLDGGTRLLGRVLPIARTWRLLIVALAVVGFLGWVVTFAGSQIVDQAEHVSQIVTAQVGKISDWAAGRGLLDHPERFTELGKEALGSLGRVTSAVTDAFGAIASLVMIVVIGVFLAVEPRIYERGIAWLFPIDRRDEFYETASDIGKTLRRLMAGRLLAMTVEGFATYILLSMGNVQMAGLLGLITGLLAFLPNIGALVSGTLIVLVGFSTGTQTGYWAIGVYLFVHIVDGYLIVPMVAKRSVDLAPALVLAAQLIFGALFGILGLALADPIVAMIKVALERGSENMAERAELVQAEQVLAEQTQKRGRVRKPAV